MQHSITLKCCNNNGMFVYCFRFCGLIRYISCLRLLIFPWNPLQFFESEVIAYIFSVDQPVTNTYSVTVCRHGTHLKVNPSLIQ